MCSTTKNEAESIKLIVDPIHKNIIYSKLEARIFSNVLFNRLHNILQNSVAFNVFPSCRTSRFAHSVGVMHLAGLIFKNALMNAQENCLNDFMEKYSTILMDIIKNSSKDDYQSYYELTPDKIVPKLLHSSVISRMLQIFSIFCVLSFVDS